MSDATDTPAKPQTVNTDPWLDTPHRHLGGATPRSLVGTDRERELRDVLGAARYGEMA